MIEKHELHTDVFVLGSGPSGFAAAYIAASKGCGITDVDPVEIREKIGI